MEIKIEKIIPREVLEDVFVTALEGGSTYWYFLSEEAVDEIRAAVPKSEDKCLSTSMLKAILDHDVDVFINDLQNEDDVIGIISIKTLYNRLSKLSSDDDYSWALNQEVEGNGDAESSDVIFQYLAMGEVVFG